MKYMEDIGILQWGLPAIVDHIELALETRLDSFEAEPFLSHRLNICV